MRVIGDKNQISEDVFDFMISYLTYPQKSIHSELAKLFFHQYKNNNDNDDNKQIDVTVHQIHYLNNDINVL